MSKTKTTEKDSNDKQTCDNAMAFEYLDYLKKWRCYRKDMNWVAFSGFGETKPEAEMDYRQHMFNLIKHPCSVVAVKITA